MAPKPTLVLLHGLLNDERVWQPVASRLDAHADLCMPNLRRQDSMAQMSRDAWAEVAEVPLTTPLVLAVDVGTPAAIRQLRAIIERADHRALLGRFVAPALVLCGREDRITPLVLSQESAALLPQAKLVVVEDAGHWAPMEQPGEVAVHLIELLSRLE